MQMNSMEGDILGDHESLTSTQEQRVRPDPVSFKLHPGFLCFFQKWAQVQKISYHECYNRVMRSHFQLQKIRTPIQKLFKRGDKSFRESSKQIYLRSSKKQRIYIQTQGEPIQKYEFGKEKEEQIEQVQKQLELYRKRREEAVAEKRKQFNKIREQEELFKQREADEKLRRQKVLDQINGELEQQKKRPS